MKVIRHESPFEELFGFQLAVTRLVTQKYLKGKNVLDVGCGFGWFENFASSQNVKKLIGLDPSKEVLKIAKRIKHKNIFFVHGTAINLPFKDKAFDTVVSWEVIEHIPRHTESIMFSEIYRVLKPGGYLFCSTQHADFFSTTLDPAWWLIGHRHYKTKTLVEFIESSGLEVTNVSIRGGVYSIIYTLNLYISKWIFRRGLFFKKFFNDKLTEEFMSQSGYADITLTCHKPLH